MAIVTPHYVLSDDFLARCGERAPVYDRENRFFDEDFEKLRQAGYLRMAVPEELGGLGMSLAQVCQEQRRLAYYAAPTALAVNMHLYWTGPATDLWRAGDKSLEWLLIAVLRDTPRRVSRARCSRRADALAVQYNPAQHEASV